MQREADDAAARHGLYCDHAAGQTDRRSQCTERKLPCEKHSRCFSLSFLYSRC